MEQLPDQLAADRAAVAERGGTTSNLIRQQLNLSQVDGKSLTNYLLGEQITAPVNEAVAWVRWAHGFVPARGQVVADPPARGADILFAGCQQLPDMLVKAVRLDGRARMGGQPVELVGVVRDWTNQPASAQQANHAGTHHPRRNATRHPSEVRPYPIHSPR